MSSFVFIILTLFISNISHICSFDFNRCSISIFSTSTQLLFQTFSTPKSLKTGIILPLFKGKGVKANDKNKYRGITLFPTLCKMYEMILLNRLEKFAVDKGYFSQLQFGFFEGVGCIEASFMILETINHVLERGE